MGMCQQLHANQGNLNDLASTCLNVRLTTAHCSRNGLLERHTVPQTMILLGKVVPP